MNKEKKRQLAIHIARILAGVLIIIPVFNETSWLRFIALAGFLLIMSSVIWFVRNSEEILYYAFPTKSVREKKTRFKDKIWQHLSVVAFLGGLIFLIIQMNHIDYIIEESKFWRKIGLIGFGVSVLFLVLLHLLQPSVFYESGRRYAVIFGFVLGLTCLTIASFSFINKNYATSKIKELSYSIDEKTKGGKRNNTHWIFVTINNDKKRLKVSPKLWNQLNSGNNALLKIQNGYFDYDYILEIKPIKEKEWSN